MTANKPMTGEQLDELMTIAVNMQRDSEKVSGRPAAMFAYAVQVAVLELRKVRNEAAALAAENAGLKNAITAISKTSEECEINGDELKYVVEPSEFDALTDLLDETPATDAFLAEVRAQAHKEGAHFVANRMLAAWEAGFIDDTAKNAADIARMILTSTEFMADAPEGDFDRSFADGVLEDIAAQIRKGVQS
ncbi:ead/Ea22-like family protein [Enterobacter hormaechei]|uniref:ead/Ea22-like family protein n=1 Tax=Enterobacter hormaechei TaxID=158836 RepID=UPI0039C0070F